MHGRAGLALLAACAMIVGGCGRPQPSAAPALPAQAQSPLPASGGSTAENTATPAAALPQPATQVVSPSATAQDRGKPDVTRSLTKEEESSGMPMAGQVNNHSTLEGKASTPAGK